MRIQNMSKIAVLILFLITFLVGCDDPKKAIVPSNISSWKSEQKFKDTVQKLSEEEKRLFVAYAMRAGLSQAFGGQGLKEGLTVGEAIEIQKSWQFEQQKEKDRQRILADEIKQKQLVSFKEMNEALTVTLIGLEFKKSDPKSGKYQDSFDIQAGFKNNTTENLAGVKGTVILKDMFGEIIKQINLSNDQGIKARETMTYGGSMDFNQFLDEDKRLQSIGFDKLQFEWQPDIYIFDGGKKLEMPK
jgi:hypothetical protein